MLPHHLFQTLVAFIMASTTPIAAMALHNPKPRQSSNTTSITIQSISFYIFAHVQSTDPEAGVYQPFVNYGTTIQLGDLWGSCNNYVYSPWNSTGGTDCAGVPDVDTLATTGCPPPGDFDGLQGASWSITRYGDRYVQQFNVPDQEDMETVYVACFEFERSQFECYPQSNYQFQGVPDSPYTMDLVATVGGVCPSY